MKNLFLSLILCLTAFCSAAQWTEKWMISQDFDSTIYAPDMDLQMDHEGHLLFSASYSYWYPGGMRDGFLLMKADTQGQVLWMNRYAACLKSMAIDEDNNVILCGLFEDTVNIFDSTIAARGGTDIFLAKLTPAGDPVWVMTIGGDNMDEAAGALVIGNKIVVTGTVRSNPNFAGSQMQMNRECRPFVASFYPDGVLDTVKIWETEVLTQDTAASYLKIQKPVADPYGNIYALWLSARIMTDTENGPVGTGPTAALYGSAMVSIDTSFAVTGDLFLGDEPKEDFYGLALDDRSKPFLVRHQWSQYSGTWSVLWRYDDSLNITDTVFTPVIQDLANCAGDDNDVLDAMFINEGHIVATALTGCNIPESDSNAVVYYIDTAGHMLSHTKYKLGKKRFRPLSVITGSKPGEVYLAGFSNSGYAFRSETVGSGDVFILRLDTVRVPGTGSGEARADKTFSVFPNPSTGLFGIRMEGEGPVHAEVIIRNVIGEVVMNENILISNNVTKHIDLSRNAPGLYLVEVKHGDARYIARVTLESSR